MSREVHVRFCEQPRGKFPRLTLLVVRGEPSRAPSEIMRVIKSISAREFFHRYPEIKRQYFWGGKLWTQSYFVESIGNANEETIREYVQNQLAELDKRESRSKQLGFF